MQLAPLPTPQASAVGGHVDRRRPHTVNHVITGFLGDLEIVLASYDNGDVVGYYVNEIFDEILRRHARSADCLLKTRRDPCQQPHALVKPFFQENVCRSAWGLAIHSQSRLIAVSSNALEITVFAFAIKDETEQGDCLHCVCGGDVESQIRRRFRNWKIYISMGNYVKNMPNIAFIDDEAGEAEMICAMDIYRSAWVANIWKPGQPARRFEKKPSFREMNGPRGHETT